ncbi:hypothetical protein ZIOFF_041377 [Zingiber officinale]|uniref:Trehalase n=1 Tax=Zingiber officinale TaxID=94328 RepID=A0A8J5G842_ZINOF|nr:hypothetical protein ZIOFF_041377 [Zingiber officinale]
MARSNSASPLAPLLLLFLLLFAATDMADAVRSTPITPLIAFLQSLQSAALASLGSSGFDPKVYVDLPLKQDLASTQAAFDALPRVDGVVPAATLQRYVDEYFGAAGSDLVVAQPVDFVAEPEGFLPKVERPEVRSWALQVHALWKNLSRRVADEVREQPERHTLLPLPGPVVVPGSRFREVYYWDSYWSIRGLLASKMYETAKEIVRNLLSLVETYGFVLNGARAYYTNRSQPPLLSAMVFEIYERTGDMEFVKQAVPLLLKEHKFWNSEVHKVTVQDAQGHKHSLYRYNAMWDRPRPESGTIDEESASRLSSAAQRRNFYHQVASTAESGWDFSSRWMRCHGKSRKTDVQPVTFLEILERNRFILAVCIIVASLQAFIPSGKNCQKVRSLQMVAPAGPGFDLTLFSVEMLQLIRSFLYAGHIGVCVKLGRAMEMEYDISYFSKIIGDSSTSEKFAAASKARMAAIRSIFWNSDMAQWLDYWLMTNNSEKSQRQEVHHQNHHIFASNFVPLWIRAYGSDGKELDRVVKSFQNSGLLHSAGIATSLTNTGQQWDFPNGWAPLQHMIVEGLANSGSKEARSLAEDIAIRWIRTNYVAYQRTGVMHEKYDVQACGDTGSGGEYAPQTGFGWSNGVALAFLEEFGWPHDRAIDCD